MLDGLGSIPQYVGRAVENGQSALAITDHGNICGAPQFYHECRKASIEPIIGEEFYFVPDASWRPQKGDKVDRYHVVILARGERGYAILSELSTGSFRNFYHKPLLDRAMVESLSPADREHLVVLSGCAGSIISEMVRAECFEDASAETKWWAEQFPHFFMELQHHDTEFDRHLNEGLVTLAQQHDLPWVITNDPHYAVPEDDCHHDVLLALQTASDIDDPNRFRFDGHGYHLRTRREMRQAFAAYEADIFSTGARNTLEIAKLCSTRIPRWESRTWQIPRYPDAEDSYRELRRLALRGLRDRGLDGNREYVRRTKHELKVFKEVGIADFLLITRDAVMEARRRGIPVGPGRGSVCGTLVGYLIGIHKVDSIRYNLMFERFLNPARPRMPDIDTDFGQRRRQEMFEYTTEKYGSENVIHVAAYQNMKVKSAFQQLARAYGVNFADRNRLSKEIIEDKESDDFFLPDEITEQYPDLAEQLGRLNGVKKSISTHPAGVIIADPAANIREQVPLMYIPSSKKWVGQFDLGAIEDMGLMKQDYLGLRTLDTIDECVKMLAARGVEVDPDSWIPDEERGDKKIYRMLAEGRTAGVFQMEGPTNQRGCLDVKPTCFEDIVSITSLYRTGPIAAGFPKMFIENRIAGRENIAYPHPILKEILGPTWGVILYQEQVMEMGERLAGFDMVAVDDLKEAIKHKKSALMGSMRKPFIRGCVRESGMEREDAKVIWKQIEGYSGYAYNRSHAVAYSLLTYQTARLKRFYPTEYIASLLRTVEDKDKREIYLREAVETKLAILPPCVNASGFGATPVYAVPGGPRAAIRFGLGDLAGIGEKQAQKILEARATGEFETVDQVAAAARNVGVMKVLKDGSALESLGVPGNMDRTEALLKWTLRDRMAPYREKYADKICLPEGGVEGEDVTLLGEIYNITKGTTKNGKPYLTWKIRHSITQSFDIRLWAETEKYWDLKPGSIVMVRGQWETRWLNLSVGRPSQIKVIKKGKD